MTPEERYQFVSAASNLQQGRKQDAANRKLDEIKEIALRQERAAENEQDRKDNLFTVKQNCDSWMDSLEYLEDPLDTARTILQNSNCSLFDQKLYSSAEWKQIAVDTGRNIKKVEDQFRAKYPHIWNVAEIEIEETKESEHLDYLTYQLNEIPKGFIIRK